MANETVERSTDPPDRDYNEFDRVLRHILIERNITTPGGLFRLLERSRDQAPSRGTVYSNFTNPQIWFVYMVIECFEKTDKPFTEEEERDLWAAFLKVKR